MAVMSDRGPRYERRKTLDGVVGLDDDCLHRADRDELQFLNDIALELGGREGEEPIGIDIDTVELNDRPKP